MKRGHHHKLFPPHRVSGVTRLVQSIVCSACEREEQNCYHTIGSDSNVAGHFGRRGWHVSSKGRHICPTCQKAARKPARGENDVQQTA